MPQFDTEAIKGDLLVILKDVLEDTTNIHVQAIVTGIARDSFTIAQMKVQGVDESLIADAERALKARAESAARIPGLVAAHKTNRFLEIVGAAANSLINMGFNTLRAYAGLPPNPTA